MRTLIAELASDLIALFYPDLCRICDKHQPANGQQICIHCLSELQPTDYNHIDDNPFITHFYGRVKAAYGACLYHYGKDGAVRKLLHAIKYKHRKEIAHDMGKQLAHFFNKAEQWQGLDAIVPVPLHPRKLRLRGYNQCQLIAAGISEVLHIPICPLIKRVKFSTSQTKKGRAGRIEALNGVFEPDPDAIRMFREEYNKKTPKLLLLDDVLTTGATLEACSLALLKGYPDVELYLATLAMGRM